MSLHGNRQTLQDVFENGVRAAINLKGNSSGLPEVNPYRLGEHRKVFVVGFSATCTLIQENRHETVEYLLRLLRIERFKIYELKNMDGLLWSKLGIERS